MNATKKIFLETFGCQMNVLDSELVEAQLRALGYAFTPNQAEADVVLYNTCSVREHSEQKVWSRLGTLKERKAADPSLVVGVIGCMAERDGVGLMKRMPQVDLMCGPGELDQLPALLENVINTGRQQHALAGNTVRRSKVLQAAEADGLELLDLSRTFSPHEQRYQAYVRIVRGCNKFCTYCVVPYTRGPEVSRHPQAIFDECRKLVDAGCLEITLLGQTVNHYIHADDAKRESTTFAELLTKIHDGIPDLARLRFITSFPADFGDDILHAMAQSPRICRYLHIPAQSGSDRILKMMNRGYTADQYLNLLDRARKILPGVALAGDFIVGFPTETEEDFDKTRDLVEKARYKNCFIFKYSERPGTLAVKKYPDEVPEETKRRRNHELLRIQNRICGELNRELVGQSVEILCEGPSGWKKNEDSVVAAATPGSVTLGPSLQKAVQSRSVISESVEKFTSEKKREIPVQMTGRTQADQVVVFDGTPEMEGRIVRVKVASAHGLTIFAELEEMADLTYNVQK